MSPIKSFRLFQQYRLHFIFREDSLQRLSYDHQENAMWKALCERIMNNSKSEIDTERDSGLGVPKRPYQLPSIHLAE
jgi:hypothetical protein